MSIKTTSKSSLFLMELIISILFFSLSSAVCIQLFVKAHNLDLETTTQNHGVLCAQNIAEEFLGVDGDSTALGDLFSYEETASDTSSMNIYFNKKWDECPKDSAIYTASIAFETKPSLLNANISIQEISQTATIYELTISKHIPNTSH